MGGAMASIGTARLVNALECHGADHTSACQEYHTKLRPFFDEVQARAISSGIAFMFPSDDAKLAERDRRLSEGSVDL